MVSHHEIELAKLALIQKVGELARIVLNYGAVMLLPVVQCAKYQSEEGVTKHNYPILGELDFRITNFQKLHTIKLSIQFAYILREYNVKL